MPARTKSDLRRIWCCFKGQPVNAQVAILSPGITEADLEPLEDEAAGARVGTAHLELPRGSDTDCLVCGIVDVGGAATSTGTRERQR